MTITCEKCSTRFVLDELRIPPKGARVRCSRCQHRFHVKPPPVRASPDEIAEKAIEHSARAERAGREGEGDGALDNPEFLFDPGAEPRARRQPTPPTGPELTEPGADGAAATHDDSPAEPSPFGAPPESGLGLPDVSQDTAAAPSPTRASTDAIDPSDFASGDLLESGSLLGDVDPRGGAAPQQIPVEPVAEWQGFARDEMPVAPDEQKVETAVRGSRAPSPRESASDPWLPRVAASLLAAALLVASVRTLHAGFRATFAPPLVRGAGWIATDIDAFHVLSSGGEPILVLRGALAPEAAAPPPRVRVVLLDAQGQPAAERDALLRRLDGAELSPGALATLLAGGGPHAESPVRGFTALVTEPVDGAERYRVELLSASDAPR